MNTHKQPQSQSVNLPEQAAHKGVGTELSAEALHNLTGYFDVLIRMDFAEKQRNKLGSQNNDKTRDTDNTNARS